VRLSGAANGAEVAADGAVGTARTLGIAAAVTAAAAALSGRAAVAFSSILWHARFATRPLRVRHRPEYGRWAAWAAPGRRRAAWARPGGGLGACRGPWAQQRLLLGAAVRFRSRFCAPDQLVEKHIVGTRSDLGCNVEYGSDLGWFGHAKVMYFHGVYTVLVVEIV